MKSEYKIGGHWFKIEFKSEKREQYDKMATTLHWENRIIIQKDLVESKQISSLFHEVLHEIDKQHFLDLRETQITTIAEGFYAFLVDNGMLKKEEITEISNDQWVIGEND